MRKLRGKKKIVDTKHFAGDPKIVQEFNELRLSNSFQNEVKRFRKSVGFPENGFKNSDESVDYIWMVRQRTGENIYPLVEKAAEKIKRRLKLGEHLHFSLMAYLQTGENQVRYEPMDARGIKIKYDYKGIDVRITAGARLPMLIELVSAWWPIMDSHLSLLYPDDHNKQIKIKPNFERDKKIFELYKNHMVFKSDGNFNTDKALIFLKLSGIEVVEKGPSLRKYFTEIGIPLPTARTIKEIIQTQAKLRSK